MTGVRINSLGPITDGSIDGTTVDMHVSSSGFGPYKVQAATAHVLDSSASFVVAAPGLNTISGSFACVIALPTASLNAGAMFMFRNVSGKANVLTGSSLASIAGGLPGTYVGSKLTMSASSAGSVILWSDGSTYLQMFGSGTIGI